MVSGSPLQTLVPRTKQSQLFVLLTLVFGCSANSPAPSAQFSSTAANAAGAVTISIATYNVENFWDDLEENSAPTLRYEDYSSKSSDYIQSKAYETKGTKVAEALTLAGIPDIVGFQEMESGSNSGRSLDLLKPHLEALGYRYFAFGMQSEDKPVSVTTAFASRFPILLNSSLVLDYAPEGASEKEKAELRLSARNPQVVEVQLPENQKVRIYNSHWKSKRGDGELSNQMRLATGHLIASDVEQVRAKDPALDVVVLGDFNTDYREANIMNDGLGQTGDKRQMLQATPSDKLYSLWFDLPENERCSYSYSGNRTCIDHMLLSDSLYDKTGLQVVDGSFRVVGRSGGPAQAALLGADGAPFPWQVKTELSKGNKFSHHPGQGHSDHLPLVADFIVTGKRDLSKLTQAELIAKAWSTIETPPPLSALLPESVPVCSPEETFVDALKEKNISQSEFWNRCVSISVDDETPAGQDLVVTKDGPYQVKVDLPTGVSLGLTMTRSYAQNQDNLRNVVQKSVGDKVRRYRGRLGWSGGVLSIFAEDLKQDVEFVPFEKPCSKADDVSLDLETVLKSLAHNPADPLNLHGVCVGFEKQQLQGNPKPTKGSRPGVPTRGGDFVSSSGQATVSLYVSENEAQGFLPAPRSYEVTGYASAIALSSGRVILHTLANGRRTGKILAAHSGSVSDTGTDKAKDVETQ